MQKFTLIPYLTISILCSNAMAMEVINYKQATDQHVQPIVSVINKDAINDNTKIVILPKKFRTMAIEQDIRKKRLYCATNSSQEVVAFKKLFILDNEQEFNDIATQEIRCLGKNSVLKKTQFFKSDDSIALNESHNIVPISFENSTIIYFGGDYTVPAYRNQRINSHLTNHAFDAIKSETIQYIKTNKIDSIVLLYGLTKTNAGETNNGIDRTPSIIRAFRHFAEQVTTDSFNSSAKNNIIIHNQYNAFMPTFDPENTECVPLPDDKAIAGYGNVLIFRPAQ